MFMKCSNNYSLIPQHIIYRNLGKPLPINIIIIIIITVQLAGNKRLIGGFTGF